MAGLKDMGDVITMERQPLPSDVSLATRRAIARERQVQPQVTLIGDWKVFTVPSDSHPGALHQIKVSNDPKVGDLVWFTCTCVAGQYRTDYPVPCVHSAAVARFMVGHRVIDLVDGQFTRVR